MMAAQHTTAAAAAQQASADADDARAALWRALVELDDLIGRTLAAASAAATLADAVADRHVPSGEASGIGLRFVARETLDRVREIDRARTRIFELAKAARLDEKERPPKLDLTAID